MHAYKPVRFFLITFGLTWALWIPAAFVPGEVGTVLMLLGLLVPCVNATVTVLASGSDILKADLKAKLTGAFRVKPMVLAGAIALFFAIVAASILLSTLFGESMDQFSLVEGFSFSIGGTPALLTLVLAAVLEEIGWRAYAEDSIANCLSWWSSSLVFGILWALWHLPLFLVKGTYQYGLLAQNPLFMANFFVSIIALVFIFTWVYVKNDRSIFACVVFHFFVNLLQEKIAMTQITKCVQTIVLMAVAAAVVAANGEMFFEKDHVGRLLESARFKKGNWKENKKGDQASEQG